MDKGTQQDVGFRSDALIVQQTEQIAALAARQAGFELAAGATFHASKNPRAQGFLRLAYRVQEVLTCTDVNNAVVNLGDEYSEQLTKAQVELAELRHQLQTLQIEAQRLQSIEVELRNADALNGQLGRQLQDARRVIDQLDIKLGDQVVFRGDVHNVYAIGDKSGTFDLRPIDGKSGDHWRSVPPCAMSKVMTLQG